MAQQSPAASPAPAARATETVTLTHPIARKQQDDITEITLREPSPGELRGIKLANLLQLDVNTLITMLPRIAQPPISESQVAQMRAVDFQKLSAAVIGFFIDMSEAEAQAEQA